MVQKRPASDRINKYTAKISGDIAKQRYDATKDLSVNAQRGYFARAEKLEAQVKSIVNGVPSIQQHFYIAYAEEMAKKHTQGEWDIVFNKWKSRGLSSALLVNVALLVVPQYVPPAKRYEYYNVGDDAQLSFYTVTWLAQTFTVGTVSTNENFNISFVRVKLRRTGDPGQLIVSIQGVGVDDKPDGVELTSGVMDGNIVTLTPGGAWYDVYVTPYELQASARYSIVLKSLEGSGVAYLMWRYDTGEATYLGGDFLKSANSGATWTLYSERDAMFEVWGRAT